MELENYRVDDSLARRYRHGSLLGMGFVLFFMAASVLALYLWNNRLAGLGFAILSILSLARYIYRQQKKVHPIRCSSCGESMAVVDVPFPEEKLSFKMDSPDGDFTKLFLVSFTDAEGQVYQISSGGDSDVFHFFRLVERYYVCHACKVCFQAENRIYLPVANVTGEIEAAAMKERILQESTNPNLG